MPSARAEAPPRWLVLIHQIPPKPVYFRAKVGRRLNRIGAVAIKNSVYVLPANDQTREDFQWVVREILADGGEATLCTAGFVEGLTDDRVEALFHAARDADYGEVADEARELLRGLPPRLGKADERREELEDHLARLRKRLAEIAAIDFFPSSGRVTAESTLDALSRRLERNAPARDEAPSDAQDYRGRTWVTRRNIHVDRIASAWLIRRFIDPEATFKFVNGNDYRPAEDELTFDMYEGTFTHVGDACTFETLMSRFELKEPGLRAIAEVVHDIDVKDGKFGREEAPGFATMIAGIALAHREDDKRIEVGTVVLDAMLMAFARKPRGGSR